ncbi:MAG TPA: preprotein translocase subunit SecG [Firmicutes bacterium]|nr:preprotein translocase subunit SecG [Candidatus Fermentithermobacillaceae bacterium]
METVVRVFHWIITIGLISVVILQPGRSAGLGIMGGGMEGMSGRKKKGLEALFAKLTVYLAVGFMVSSLALTFLRR